MVNNESVSRKQFEMGPQLAKKILAAPSGWSVPISEAYPVYASFKLCEFIYMHHICDISVG